MSSTHPRGFGTEPPKTEYSRVQQSDETTGEKKGGQGCCGEVVYGQRAKYFGCVEPDKTSHFHGEDLEGFLGVGDTGCASEHPLHGCRCPARTVY